MARFVDLVSRLGLGWGVRLFRALANRRRLPLWIGGAGTLLFSVGIPIASGDHGAATVAFWGVDRTRDRVLGLDARFQTRRRIDVSAPRFVVARRGGGGWIATDPRSPFVTPRLLRFDADARVDRRLEVGPVRALEADRRGGALLIVGEEGEEAVVRVSGEGEPVDRLAVPGARCLAVAGSRALVGRKEAGVLLLTLRPRLAVREWGLAGRDVRRVRAAERRGDWWVLEGGEEARVHRLDFALERRWSRTLEVPAGDPGRGYHGGSGAEIVAVPHREAVWWIGPGGERAGRLGARGVLEQETFDLPRFGTAGGVGEGGGGVVWACGGALLRFDGDGTCRRTQGGFGYLTDLDAVPQPLP